MFKNLLLLLCVLLFSGCSSMIYSYNHNNSEIKFNIEKEEFLTKKLSNTEYIYTSDPCVIESYLLVNSSLFIEHINLDSNCTWNGSSDSFFESLFKEKLKLKSLEALERVNIEKYTFSVLKINNTHRLHTITIWGATLDTFIIDYEGRLFKELSRHLGVTYKNTFDDLPLFKTQYKQSLVQHNTLKNYFNASANVPSN